MEILSVANETEKYWGLLFLNGLGIALILIGIAACISEIIKKKTKSTWSVLIVLLIALILPLTGFTYTIKEGVNVQYKVIVDDINELHENGYEIVDQEGKIFTIEKK
jgi:hypothetical protein